MELKNNKGTILLAYQKAIAGKPLCSAVSVVELAPPIYQTLDTMV